MLFDGIKVTDTEGLYWRNSTYNTRSFIPDTEEIYDLFPMYFILDMGRKASYSRLKVYNRNRQPVYSGWIWIEFDLWGANEVKPFTEVGNGSQQDNLKYWTSWEFLGGTDQWKEGWEKLATCIVTFPSGTPNTVTQATIPEDIAFVQAGFEYEIDPDMVDKPFRYLRFEMKRNNIQGQLHWAELEFFGAYAE